jgi:hypothetical protein
VTAARARWRGSVLLAIAWRYATHAAMVALALWNERRPAPRLPDLVLELVPRVDWIARHNYHLWFLAWVPVSVWLLVRDREACLRFLWIGGWVSLLRGVTIPLTGLGPVDGADVNAGASAQELFHSWIAIVNPVSALSTDAPHLWLTKDLFFSGHVASTFLLWLYCRPHPRIAAVALAGHLATTAFVLFAHLHYAIDVVGAWAIAFSVYVLVEGWSGLRSSGATAAMPAAATERRVERP